MRGTTHQLTTLTSLVSLLKLEENLDLSLMNKSQQHHPSTLLPIAVSTIISAAYNMMWYLPRRYLKKLSKNDALSILNVITLISYPTQDLKIGDIVRYHVQVQYNSDNVTVKKLSYQVCRPFKIIEDIGHNSLHVQPLDDDNGSIRKYKDTELYLLPPALFLSDHLDTPDKRYLNYEN